jgi:hypothetical protein
LAEGLVVCATPEDVVAEDVGVVLDEGAVVEVEFCCGVADGLELELLGEDCAKAEVAIERAAVVVNSRRLFI